MICDGVRLASGGHHDAAAAAAAFCCAAISLAEEDTNVIALHLMGPKLLDFELAAAIIMVAARKQANDGFVAVRTTADQLRPFLVAVDCGLAIVRNTRSMVVGGGGNISRCRRPSD